MLYCAMHSVRRGHTIGVTGNIASGKSSVARRLGERGALVIDADILAHELMRPGLPAWQGVVAEFGEGVLAPDRAIDRAKLRAIVFADRAALARLNAAVHPHVDAELLRRIAALASDQVAVIEAVALVEAGTHRALDALWLVLSSPERQVERLMRARGLTREDAAWRVAAQPPVEGKIPLADVVIRNEGSLETLHAAVDRAWEQALGCWGEARSERETP